MVNQQARDITGYFKSTNQLMPLSGTLPPQQSGTTVRATHGIPFDGGQAGQLFGVPSKRLTTHREHETTSLREDTPPKADVIVCDRGSENSGAKTLPGIDLKYSGSIPRDNRACGYSGLGERPARLMWRENPHGNQPGSLRCRMRCNRRSVGPGSGAGVTIFTDAQVACS